MLLMCEYLFYNFYSNVCDVDQQQHTNTNATIQYEQETRRERERASEWEPNKLRLTTFWIENFLLNGEEAEEEEEGENKLILFIKSTSKLPV